MNLTRKFSSLKIFDLEFDIKILTHMRLVKAK